MGIKGIGKEGRFYIKFLVAAALLFTLAFSLYTFAANPSSSPAIVTNANYTNSNVSSAFANNVLFGYANFTSQNGTTEANSTFKWYKRTLYQPQNRSLVGYWKLDGNANGLVEL